MWPSAPFLSRGSALPTAAFASPIPVAPGSAERAAPTASRTTTGVRTRATVARNMAPPSFRGPNQCLRLGPQYLPFYLLAPAVRLVLGQQLPRLGQGLLR